MFCVTHGVDAQKYLDACAPYGEWQVYNAIIMAYNVGKGQSFDAIVDYNGLDSAYMRSKVEVVDPDNGGTE